MNDQPREQIGQVAPAENDGWEWMLVEIMGHRTHWGRARQEERFGAKMLRIDVPKIITFERSDPGGPAVRLDPPGIEWVTHYYGGASIFSFTLTDEATVMARNKPYEPPARLIYSPSEGDDFSSEASGRDEDDLDNEEAA